MGLKKGFFFSTDGFFALILFVVVLLSVYSYIIISSSTEQQYYFSEDLMDVFSSVTVGEVSYLSLAGYDADFTILEVIVEEKDNDVTIEEIITELTSGLMNEQYGIKLSVTDDEGVFQEIFSSLEDAPTIVSRERMVYDRSEDKFRIIRLEVGLNKYSGEEP